MIQAYKSEHFLLFFFLFAISQNHSSTNQVRGNTEGRTIGGPKNKQFSYGRLSAQLVLTDDVNASILSLRGMQAFYTHCIFIVSHMCTRINLRGEKQPPVGCNAEVDNCHRLFASPLNEQEHPGCSCRDRANAPYSQWQSCPSCWWDYQAKL